MTRNDKPQKSNMLHEGLISRSYLLAIGYFFASIFLMFGTTVLLGKFFEDEHVIRTNMSYVGIGFQLLTALAIWFIIERYNKRLKSYRDAYLNSEKMIKRLSYDNQKSELYTLLTNYVTDDFHDEEEVSIRIFEYLMKRLEGCDRGSVMKVAGDKVRFLYSIGYNLDSLNSMRMKPEDIDFYPSGIQHRRHAEKFLEKKMDPVEYRKYQQMNPAISESIYLGLVESSNFRLGVSLDISQESFKANHHVFTDEMIHEARSIQLLVSAMFKMKDMVGMRNEIQKGVSMAFITAFEHHDEYMKGHSVEVARIAKLIGECLDYDDEDLNELYWAAMLHDLGKIVIPTEVLKREGPLTDDEYIQVKMHCELGETFIKNSPGLENIATYIRHHHERFDGKGYPDGLAGEDIPLTSRIITIADSYHAMITDRPYRKKMETPGVLQEIINGDSRQFCPLVTEAFLQMFDRIKTEADQ